MQWCSCQTLRNKWILDGFLSSWPATRFYVTHQCLGFHDAHVRLLTDHQQIVHNVASDLTFVAPVIWQSNLVNCAAIDFKRSDAGRNHHPSFNRCSWRGDCRKVAVLQSDFSRELWRDFR